MKITAKLIYSNVLTNYLNTITAFFYTLLLTPFILHHIGAELYGVWLICQIFISYLNYLDFETDTALVKYLAQYWSEDDNDKANGLFTTLLIVYCFIGLIIFLFSMSLGRLVLPYLGLSHESSSTAIDILPYVGCNVMIVYLALAFDCALMAKGKYYVDNVISVFTSILGGILTLFVLWKGGQLIELIIVDIVLNGLKLSALSFYVVKMHRIVTIQVHRFNFDYFRKIKTFTLWYFFGNSLGDSLAKLSTLFISAYFSASYLTAVAMYLKMPDILEAISEPVYGFFMPFASSMHGRDDCSNIRKMFLIGTRVVILIILPGLVLFFVKGNQILELWLGDQFIFLDWVLPVVLITGGINIISTPAHLIVIGSGGVKLSFKAQLYTAVITIIFICGMWPMESVAEIIIAFCLADTLIEIFYFIPKSCQFTHIKIEYLIKKIYTPFVMLSLILWSVVHSYYKIFPENSYKNLLLISLILGVLTLFCGYKFILEIEEKENISHVLEKLHLVKRNWRLNAQR